MFMKLSKTPNLLVAISMFLSVGVFITEVSSPRLASAYPVTATTVYTKPPGRGPAVAVPAVTTTVYTKPPGRGPAVAVPAVTTTVYTRPPTQPIVTAPRTTAPVNPLPKNLPNSSDFVLENMSPGGLLLLAYAKWGLRSSGPDVGLWRKLKNMSVPNANGAACKTAVITELKRQKYETIFAKIPPKYFAIYLDILSIVFFDPSVSSTLNEDKEYLKGVVTKASYKALEVARNRYSDQIGKIPYALGTIDAYLNSKKYLITSVPSAAAWAVKLGESLGLKQLSRAQAAAGTLYVNLECNY